MMKRILSGVLLLCVLGLTGCGSKMPAPTPTPAATPSATPTPAPTPEPTPTPDPVAEALAAMTTQEKVGQLLVAGIGGTGAGEDGLQAVQDYQVGGVILFGRNVESADQLADLTNELKVLNGDNIPLFLCVDQEGDGWTGCPRRWTTCPPPMTISPAEAILWSGEGAVRPVRRIWLQSGFLHLPGHLVQPGQHRHWGPGLRQRPRHGDPGGAGGERGTGAGGVIPVVKHFPGHGDTSTDSHVDLPVVDKTVEQLKEFELIPFQEAIDQGTPCVMVAHILMTQIDPDLPASLSPEVVTGLLRQELGFDGVVCTDDLTMGAISNTYGMGEAAVMAVEAGCDLLLVCHEADNLTAARDALLSAVDAGRISMERLDESVYRILSLKQEYGLTNDLVGQPDVEVLNAQIEAIS